MKLIYSGKKLSWESPELVILRLLKDQLLKIFSDTELELDGLNHSHLVDLLNNVSLKVEGINKIMDAELDRLIKRDSDVFKDHRCSHCQSEKIYVCDPCMDKWANEVKRVAEDTCKHGRTRASYCGACDAAAGVAAIIRKYRG